MRRKIPSLTALLLFGCVSLALAEGALSNPTLDAGVEAFGAERYRDALDKFSSVLADPRANDARSVAAYWSILSYLALGDQVAAESAIDAYLGTWPDGERVPDLLYQKGRILYQKGSYEGALTAFSSFLAMAPNHSLVASALYWGGECLYSLGRLEDADKVFKSVVDRYPSSVKVEAANYKRGLISLELRERELLKLLSWSHEESIRAADDFRLREKSYEEALATYEKQLADAKQALAGKPTESPELKAQIAELQTKLSAAQVSLDQAKADLEKAQSQSAATAAAAQSAVAAAKDEATKAAEEAAKAKASADAAKAQGLVPVPVSNQQEELLTAALDAKKRALDLLAFYIDRLSQGGKK